MLDNCCYNKIKLIHDLSAMTWFIKKHAIEDAQQANDKACVDLLTKLKEDLYKHQHALKHMICEEKEVLCKECK